ncbi:iron-sulfur cluster repair di-iron protein [Solitalea sp. MAHUQ-68]|uniref:Iron-sulfur cluster repair di-iron protein n=1 Tax=Solitalea agri TaxID=2953739 RepID=A0A9X2F7T2_9SPHI|nr:iron-sulfur cluster repair di-iron protein [Solitalea agri]MCO4293941.1 iron-sulfur cluster repair di-iron protein [Solitalea agri]
MEILDVTVLEPKHKHPTIFNRFDQLQAGEGFIIHNDHDPKPLYYQLLAERGATFSWEYLMEGPEWWKVRITKNLVGENDSTVGELVAKDFRKAEVFKKFGIDFCCGGKKSVKQVCSEKGVNYDELQTALNATESIGTKAENYDQWSVEFLVDYIVNKHHTYVKDSLPVMLEFAQKVARVHGANHPENIEIAENVHALAAELNMHLMKEERVLFPYIQQLGKLKRENKQAGTPTFGTVKNPVNMMEMEHDSAGELMQAISKLSNNYTPPADACTTYRVLYAKLKEFEDDLHNHIHLENNILFPKAIELEAELMGKDVSVEPSENSCSVKP